MPPGSTPDQCSRQQAYRLLIADVYELEGTSRRTSESIAAMAGQTTARWHVLSVLSTAPATVATVARRLGLARQSVQRVADGLLADGLLTKLENWAADATEAGPAGAGPASVAVSGRRDYADALARPAWSLLTAIVSRDL